MSVPIKYHAMNVLRRWKTALGAWLNIALVVAVYVIMQSLASGLDKVTQETGVVGNMLVLRKGSVSESASTITQDQWNALRYDEAIQRGDGAIPVASAEIISVVNLPRLEGKGEANVPFRGLTPTGIALRPQVRLTEGRWFQSGSFEAVTSTRMAQRFENMRIGDSMRMGVYDLKIVGHFEAGSTAFASEVWMDLENARTLFNLPTYSSFLLRIANQEPSFVQAFRERIENDKRLRVRVMPELEYYSEQTKTVGPIRFLGYFLAVIMSIGAIFSAMNTMYAIISNRMKELGTLRAMGFGRQFVFMGLLLEGGLIGLLGGVTGAFLALPLQGIQTGTMAFETFTEIIFQFNITPVLMSQGVCFGFLIGVVGSLLPAWKAVHFPMITALKGA
jgi:putative ABC transport system permease protein